MDIDLHKSTPDMYPNEVIFIIWVRYTCTQMNFYKLRKEMLMEELKRMLEAIHKENKDILTLLFSMDKDETKEFDDIMADVNSMYDKDFYGE